MKAISLFSSGGIADLAIHKLGIEVLVANEIIDKRALLYKHNFPKCHVFIGDIWNLQEKIISKTNEILKGKELDFVLATPPCQGMSKNGRGKLLRGIRDGKKPKFDKRNQLIIPTIQIIKKLKPITVFFENVPQMVNTLIIDENDELINIIDYIERELGNSYLGGAEVVEFADYGAPQRRSRLITIYSRDSKLNDYYSNVGSYLPLATHSSEPNKNLKPWVTVRDVIKDLPPLDGKNKKLATSDIPYHNVSVLDPKKYTWISNTPMESSAFDNQCVNTSCGYQNNKTHGSSRDHRGINRANGDTPLFCEKCGELLPRPYTLKKDGSMRIMKGYTSAYKRMSWDLPASTLTTNLIYPSSDHKIHPEQNRVLSVYEAFRIHTLDEYNYEWMLEGNGQASKTLIAEVIGESVPPKIVELIIQHLLNVMYGKLSTIIKEFQLNLLDYTD